MTPPSPAPDMTFEVSVPGGVKAVTLSSLLETLYRPQRTGTYRCDFCKRCSTTVKHPQPPEISNYVIVQAERTRPFFNSDGTQKEDENGNAITGKVHTKIKVPGKMLDLSGLASRGEENKSMKYELFGMVNHFGSG